MLFSIFPTVSISLLNGFLLLLVALVYKFTKKNCRISKYLDKIPGPTSYPVIGSALTFIRPIREIIPLLLTFPKQYGPVVKMWGGTKPYVFIFGPDEIETILSSQKLIDKPHDYDLIESWIGKGLVMIRGEDWKPRRKLLNPMFRTTILENHSAVFNEQGNTLVDRLRKHADSGHHFDICSYVEHCALDIICETNIGKRLNSQGQGTESEYCNAVGGITGLMGDTCTRPWEQNSIIWRLSGKLAVQNKYLKVLHDFTEKAIAERKRQRSIEQDKGNFQPIGNEKYQKPFLDLLLDFAKEGLLSDKEIRQEVDTLMLAAYDTTLSNALWTTWLLASHPEYQKRVQDELTTIFGSDINRDITMADISKMKYLEYCIKEGLRLMPPVPFIAREICEDVTTPKGVIIPAGVTAVFPLVVIHRDPVHFPDPLKFIPERFNPENSTGRHPYSFIAFSAGPRNCIGQKYAIMELKILFAKLFMNYNVQAVKKYDENMVLIPQVSFRPLDGILVKITSRNRISKH